MENPSMKEANTALRVMSGKTLKYTVQVWMKSGNGYEFQAETKPKLEFSQEAREVVVTPEYDSSVIVRWADVDVIICEKNPETA